MPGEALSQLKGAVRTITLNRPNRLNAIGGTLCKDLVAAFDQAASCPDTRAVVLTGAGRAFCAGDDLKEFASQARDAQSAREHIEAIQAVSRAIVLGPHMVVGAIHGWAVGGGLEWLLDCDLVVMAESAKCFFPEVKLGMNVTGGASTILPKIVGLQKAREMILFGETFDAKEALRLGIAWKIVPDSEMLSTAHAAAERIAVLPKGAVRDLKQLINRACHMDFEGAMALETSNAVRQFLGPETKAAAEAFQKR
jgi:enoyl-CoA hydratase/carnithine racemase